MLGRLKAVPPLVVLAAFAVSGCGGTASHTPTESHSGMPGGHSGGQHALGSDPKAALSRIKKASGGGNSPAKLPGR